MMGLVRRQGLGRLRVVAGGRHRLLAARQHLASTLGHHAGLVEVDRPLAPARCRAGDMDRRDDTRALPVVGCG